MITMVINHEPDVVLSFQSTHLFIVPTSAGRHVREFPDTLSSVSEVMSHTAKGNSDRALLDRLRLLSLQNLKRARRKWGFRHASVRLCLSEATNIVSYMKPIWQQG